MNVYLCGDIWTSMGRKLSAAFYSPSSGKGVAARKTKICRGAERGHERVSIIVSSVKKCKVKAKHQKEAEKG